MRFSCAIVARCAATCSDAIVAAPRVSDNLRANRKLSPSSSSRPAANSRLTPNRRSGAECYNRCSVIRLRRRSAIPRRPSHSRGVAQPGRAPGSGPGGRRFKSSLPDQFFSTTSRIDENARTSKRTYIRVAGTGCARNSRHTVAAAMLTASTLSSHHVRL